MADLTVSAAVDAFMSLADPSAVVWVRFNADNTVSVRTASNMRTDLGLVIGTDVQAYDADLTSWAGKTAPSGTVIGTSDTQTLTNKTFALGSNTFSGSLAEFNAALTGADFATLAGSETLTNKTIAFGSNTITGVPVTIGLAVSDESTALTTGTGKLTFRMPHAMTLTGVRASVTTAPTGSTLIVDINEAGSTILSTKLSIDASEKTSTTAASAAVISDTALADDAEITIDIDQVGSSVAGAGLKVWLIGTR